MQGGMTHGKRYIRVYGGMIYRDFDAAHTSTEYIEPDRGTFTGLYDADGTPLHRFPEPIGYNPHRWSDTVKKSKPMKKSKGKGKGC